MRVAEWIAPGTREEPAARGQPWRGEGRLADDD